MLKRADPKHRNDVSANSTLHFRSPNEQPISFDKQLKRSVVVVDILNARRKRSANLARSLTALEVENAELRKRAIQLTLEIQHLQITRGAVRRTFST
jgi:hypothetical protein